MRLRMWLAWRQGVRWWLEEGAWMRLVVLGLRRLRKQEGLWKCKLQWLGLWCRSTEGVQMRPGQQQRRRCGQQEGQARMKCRRRRLELQGALWWLEAGLWKMRVGLQGRLL